MTETSIDTVQQIFETEGGFSTSKSDYGGCWYEIIDVEPVYEDQESEEDYNLSNMPAFIIGLESKLEITPF